MNDRIDKLMEAIDRLEKELETVKQQRDAYKEAHIALLMNDLSKADDK